MPRTSALSSLSAADLHREVERRKKFGKSLAAKRDRLLAKAAKIERQMVVFGIEAGATDRTARGTVRKRPQNNTTLPEALAKLLKGKTLRVNDIVSAVQKAGYKTSAANFRTIVNNALLGHKSLFKKVARGQYTAK